MAYRATGIGMAGDGFFVSALPILADKHFPVLTVDFQHEFATFRTFGAGHVIVAEGTVRRFNLLNECFGVMFDFFHKGFIGFFSFCDCLQAHFPGSSQFRTF